MSTIATWLLTASLALTLPTTAIGAAKAPERVVHGSTITSQHDPVIKIRLPKAAEYAGGARWDFYGVCDAELHVFVEANAQKRVQRLYWVQFEGFIFRVGATAMLRFHPG